MDDKGYFLIIYKPGPAWIEGQPIWDQPLQEHGDYLKSLYQEGKLIEGGPFADNSGSMAIICAEDIRNAQIILNNDPAVRDGIFVGEVRPWFRVEWVDNNK